MGAYILRRLATSALTLVLVSLVIFTVMRVVPGDPALLILNRGASEGGAIDLKELAALRQELGTDRPLPEQYFTWMKQIATLDLGKSFRTQLPVTTEIGRRLPYTVTLALLSTLLISTVGITLGLISALKQDTLLDYLLRVVAVGGLCIPTFLSATLIILVLLYLFQWVPPLEYTRPWADPFRTAQQLIWPVMALGTYALAVMARMTRNVVLEELRQDYVRTAKSKGLRERITVVRHVLPNAFLPLITLMGLQFAALLGGAVVIELVFLVPGVGTALIESVLNRDYPMVQNLILLFAVFVALTNLAVDILYGVFDPRVRLT